MTLQWDAFSILALDALGPRSARAADELATVGMPTGRSLSRAADALATLARPLIRAALARPIYEPALKRRRSEQVVSQAPPTSASSASRQMDDSEVEKVCDDLLVWLEATEIPTRTTPTVQLLHEIAGMGGGLFEHCCTFVSRRSIASVARAAHSVQCLLTHVQPVLRKDSFAKAMARRITPYAPLDMGGDTNPIAGFHGFAFGRIGLCLEFNELSELQSVNRDIRINTEESLAEILVVGPGINHYYNNQPLQLADINDAIRFVAGDVMGFPGLPDVSLSVASYDRPTGP